MDGVLHIENCFRAKTLSHTSERDSCLRTLRDFVTSQHDAVFGFDFPFGLPRELIREDSWEHFVEAFPTRYQSPEKFKEDCLKAAEGKELKRVTDKCADTPFSPYNLWIYRQTYFGIREVLAPMVRGHLASVLPMQKAKAHVPCVVEVCPASTLKKLKLYRPYKGRDGARKKERVGILSALEERKLVRGVRKELRQDIVDDSGGDALDSVVAALAACRSIDQQEESYQLEGYVYF